MKNTYTFGRDFSAKINVGGIAGTGTKSYKKGDKVEGELINGSVNVRISSGSIQGAQEFLSIPIDYFDSAVSESHFSKNKTIYIVITALLVLTLSIALYFKFSK